MQEPKLKIETRKGPWRSARPLYRSKKPTPKIININLLLKITPRQPTLLHPKACRISFKFVQSTERPQRTHKNSKYTESKSLIINHELKYMTGGTLSAPEDAYVRSFLYLLYTLIKLYYTKTLSSQALSLPPDWIPLLWRSRIPVPFMAQKQSLGLSLPRACTLSLSLFLSLSLPPHALLHSLLFKSWILLLSSK